MNNLLMQINFTSLWIVLAIIAVLAVVFALLIVGVSKACHVKEDERIEKISNHLAGANCGGCGFNGCADFAKALIENKAELSACGVTDPCQKKEISQILGIEFSESIKNFAVVKCSGGDNVKKTFNYQGNIDCNFVNALFFGNKACKEGCLGLGSCLEKCTQQSIKMVNGVAVVDKNTCGACGICTKTCPKNLIELIPITAKVYVACSSHCRGKEVMSECASGCIGCGLCSKNCPENAITMVNNLPIIDYTKCTGCKTCVNKCPRKTIKEI